MVENARLMVEREDLAIVVIEVWKCLSRWDYPEAAFPIARALEQCQYIRRILQEEEAASINAEFESQVAIRGAQKVGGL